MKHLTITFYIFFLSSYQCIAQAEVEHKIYDTEFGRFDLWVYGNQVAGSYEIIPKKIIGSMLAELEGSTAIGRWTDPDGSGEIILTFENELQKFRADYRNDEDSIRWYRDQWHGILRAPKESTRSICSGPSHDLIKPFIGTWEEFRLNDDNDEEFIGTLKVELVAAGCSLFQRFMNSDSSFSYSTHGFVNPGSGFWEEKYIFSTGSTADYRWIIDKGDIVQRRVGGTRPIDYLHQLRFTELSKSGYLLLQEQSSDGGRTWNIKGRTRVKRTH